MIDINGRFRELNYDVYCMGSVAKYAFKSLKYSFKGNSERMGKTNECNIELLKINKSVKFEEADDVVLLASKVSETIIDFAGTGTNLCAIVLPKGVLMSSDARITNLDSTKKLFLVRLHIWMKNVNSKIVDVGFLMENVGSEAIDDGFLMDDEFLMENAGPEVVDNGLLMENAGFEKMHVPKTYVISRFCDIVHIKNCKADGCRCSMIDINGWSRELNYNVYCMGSVAKYAFKSLKYSFKGNYERMGKTNECNIELLKINKSVKFEEADDVVLLAMLVSSFRIVSCEAPYLGI
ncbi:hypothetical protein C1H46_022796 [Malus baccata]|uniref:Uncharacterized protein n=1 Tax=Malus baccata TaxID=106549 RepID=A0A540LYP3_MALBA|nr:hypothetical protein C1H46_022796 [Malus baccata]